MALILRRVRTSKRSSQSWLAPTSPPPQPQSFRNHDDPSTPTNQRNWTGNSSTSSFSVAAATRFRLNFVHLLILCTTTKRAIVGEVELSCCFSLSPSARILRSLDEIENKSRKFRLSLLIYSVNDKLARRLFNFSSPFAYQRRAVRRCRRDDSGSLLKTTTRTRGNLIDVLIALLLMLPLQSAQAL